MQLQSGTLLQGGKYNIERVLGQGGFGITYLAAQELFDRRVCIKEFFFKDYCERGSQGEVTSCTTNSKELVDRFLNKFIKEARTISRLDHPNIVRILDIFQENGTAYYAMEYIEGCSLADKVNAQGALSEAVAVDYIKQVASALDYIHQRSINHLDVKPANIMVRQSDNKAILIDFGLSKQYDEQGGQTSTTPVGISHGYAPMEQYNQGGVSTFSPQTDIYSLGATLYKLVTGNTPPQAIEIFNEGLTELPQSLSPNLITAIRKTMQSKKGDRPQSIGEFTALLGGQFAAKPSPSISQCNSDESTRIIGTSNSESAKNISSPQPTIAKVEEAIEEKGKNGMIKFGVVIGIVVVCFVTLFLLGIGNNNNNSYTTSVPQQPAQQQSQTSKPQQPAREGIAVQTTTPLYIATTPSGATVYIDGKKVGTTPIEGKEIACGNHKVKLSKEGYQDITFTRTFGEKSMVINETLAEKPNPQPQQSQTSASSSNTSGNKKTYTVNGVSFTMVRVAGGIFTMGASSGDSEAFSDEKPAHQVTLSSYSIGETEVTQALWQAVMGSTPSHFTGNLQRPVEKVSWNDCLTFIRKLNSLTGATFRLPTEAEWEYAARGGNQSIGYKYSGGDNLGSVAWNQGNSSNTTHPVKGKLPNELGLYDMSGNVQEWCADWHDSSYYSNSPSSNPKGPSAGSFLVFRGGSWRNNARLCRVSNRYASTPSYTGSDLGLRLVSQ